MAQILLLGAPKLGLKNLYISLECGDPHHCVCGAVSSEDVPLVVGLVVLNLPCLSLKETTYIPIHIVFLSPRHITQAPASTVTTSLCLGLPASFIGTPVITLGPPAPSTQDNLA